MHAAITPELQPMLRGRGLWGEAMKEQLAAFREQGFFRMPEPLLPAELIEEVSELQKKIEPVRTDDSLQACPSAGIERHAVFPRNDRTVSIK